MLANIQKTTLILVLFTVISVLSAVFLPGRVEAAMASPAGTFSAVACSAGEAGADCRKIFTDYINPFIRLLSVAIGVVSVLMIVVGGVEYSSAGSDPQKVAAAKKRITNAIFALLAYIFLFAFLNWLIPGGVI